MSPQQLSATALVVSSILTEEFNADQLNTLGLFLSIVGDILQLNSWQMLQEQAKQS